MAKLISTCWRAIPAQVVCHAGRKSSKRQPSPRFATAIDRAAMRAGRGSIVSRYRRGRICLRSACFGVVDAGHIPPA